MNKKDLSEIKKTFKMDSVCLTNIGTCYISLQDGPMEVSISRFLTLEEEVMLKYLEIAKKGLSGKFGKNLVNLSTNGEGPIGEGALVNAYQEKNEESIKALAESVFETYVSDTDYCLICLFGTYDVPHTTKARDSFMDSEEVYNFMQFLILPIKMSKPGLAYDRQTGGIFNKELYKELNAPDQSFLYPAFTDRSTDVDHVLYYSKNLSKGQDELLSRFHAAVPQGPDEQQMKFRDIIEAGFGTKAPYEAVKGIFDTLTEKLIENTDSSIPASIRTTDLVSLVKQEANYIDEEFNDEAAMQLLADKKGEDPIFIDNVLPGKLTIQAGEATIKIERDSLSNIRRQTIDGVDYYLVPAAGSEFEGIQTKR